MGPLEGVTCTAVTLYSGQLVAQSENSVVMDAALRGSEAVGNASGASDGTRGLEEGILLTIMGKPTFEASGQGTNTKLLSLFLP